jgi:presequence protease
MPIHDPRNDALSVGDRLHGYRIDRIASLPEINAVLYRLVHEATGARHLHISRPDQENTFGVTFKTVPSDSTGVAHILEHTVLCGSKHYPVRDPFFSMLKRSLSTFMNAFTSSDWTMYPFATQNTKDFYNLMDVYLDAAFFPLLQELSFKQEGHRLEFDADDGHKLLYKGVVYNEMKGAMSSPDQVMGRSLLNALYPDTTYSNNSGGDPVIIPQLSYAQLKAFHERHYHPSNAYFYSYGSLPLDGHLAFITDKIMKRFSQIDPRTDVPAQPRWQAPRTARYTYPLAANEDPRRKSQICLAWLTCDIRDTFEVLVLSVLEQILLGNAGSPLRKALMDSGLGSALSDTVGYDADNRDTLFACGLKDTEENAGEAVQKIILDVLQEQVEQRIDAGLIETAIHQIEFHRKEVTNSPYPYGLKLLMSFMGSWLHGGDPERILRLDADMARLRAEIDKGPFLEQRIQFYFLENHHRVRLLLAPDQQKSSLEEARLSKELKDRENTLTPAERRKIEEDAVQLKQLQESQEDISRLPTLALTDIPPKIDSYAPSAVHAQLPLWRYDQPTSGIFYFSGASAATQVDKNLLHWVPFFCYAFSKIGTAHWDYSTMARRIDAATGGFKMTAQSRAIFDRSAECLPVVALNAKCLARNLNSMLEIIEEMIAEADFGDRVRLKQLLAEYVAGLETMILQSGHRLAISLSARTFSPAGAIAEMWGGVHQLRAMREFNRKIDDRRLAELTQTMTAISDALFQPTNFVMAAIGEEQTTQAAVNRIEAGRTLAKFKRPSAQPLLQPIHLDIEPALPFEGWSTSSSVAFVAQSQATVPLGHPDAPTLAVIGKLLRSLYLHREIREKGGAYGGFALYSAETGLFSMASYRDPHIIRTLNVFKNAADFIGRGETSAEDVKEAILQVCSEIDRPDPPGPAARKAFGRLIVGLDDEARLEFKRSLLTVDRERVLEVVTRYFTKGSPTGVAVIAGQEHLEEANRQIPEKPLTLESILMNS